MPPHPSRTSPAVLVLLFLITFGVYWFVWIYQTFAWAEAAVRPTRTVGKWVGVLAGLFGAWFVAQTALALVVLGRIQGQLEPTASFDEIMAATQAQVQDTLVVSIGLVALVFFFMGMVAQSILLRIGTQGVAELHKRQGRPQAPSIMLPTWFTLGFLLANTPLVGGLAFALGAALAIAWVFQIQRSIMLLTTAPPTAAPTDGPIQAGPTIQVTQQAVDAFEPLPGQRPAEPFGKTFSCPDCGTHIQVAYRPGQPTPVQCAACGTRGLVR